MGTDVITIEETRALLEQCQRDTALAQAYVDLANLHAEAWWAAHPKCSCTDCRMLIDSLETARTAQRMSQIIISALQDSIAMQERAERLLDTGGNPNV